MSSENDQPYHALAGSDEIVTNSSQNSARIIWVMQGGLYLGIIVNNFFNQTQDSWGKYAFELTQVSAWLTLAQHLLHPHSLVPQQSLTYTGQWRCLKDDTYTHSQGLSNLAITLEVLIVPMYWVLTAGKAGLSGPGSYINAVLMHGGIAGIIIADYAWHGRQFHFLHNLVNLLIFIGLYTAWNFAGQHVKGDPVYPGMDWTNEPQNIGYALGFASAAALFIAASLKLITHVRRTDCRSACLFIKQPDSANNHNDDLTPVAV